MMLESAAREALLVRVMLGWRARGGRRAVVFAVVSGHALVIGIWMARGLRFVALRWRGVVIARLPGACLGEARMTGALLGAIGMMGRVHGCENVFADFHGDLLFLRLANDGERRGAVLAGRADENLKLPGVNDLLIVVELQNIETLEAGGGRRAIRQNGFHHQTEVFGQAKLRGEDRRHRGGDNADVGHWLGRRERRVREVAGAFGAGSAVSLVLAFRPAAIRMMEVFPMFSRTLWVLAVSGLLTVVVRGATRFGAMPPNPLPVARRMRLGSWRSRLCSRRWRSARRRRCGRCWCSRRGRIRGGEWRRGRRRCCGFRRFCDGHRRRGGRRFGVRRCGRWCFGGGQ